MATEIFNEKSMTALQTPAASAPVVALVTITPKAAEKAKGLLAEKGQPDAAIVTVTSGLAYVPLVAAPTYSATKAAIHSYTVSLRTQLAGTVEVIEVAPPGVQTDLTPGQANHPGYMPLDTFADTVAAQFAQTPTPQEILVDEVQFLRQAEREGRFDETLKTLTERAAKQREAGGG